MPRPIPCPKRTQLRPSQRCTSLASLPRSKLSWEICAGWVHDQLWQKPLWKEIKECARVDYRVAVSENEGGSFPHSESKFRLRGISLSQVGLWRSWERASMAWKRSSVRSRPGPPILPMSPVSLIVVALGVIAFTLGLGDLADKNCPCDQSVY